ncbi:MAG: hypothetical protein DHS20C12_05370 [Pseudohongiella sp.]|nr:MAG: hypothetical protein DHS20C12_05370 [Pseudohongiella sp.]
MKRYSINKLELFVGFLLFSALGVQTASAQLSYRSGAEIEPGYEGWWENDDGTFSLVFGYMNENWEERPDILVGDDNFFSPGDADRGQPTHFLPRRNRFTFEVVVPSDWGDRELVWTLTHNGETNRAYGTLTTDYLIDNMVIASETGSLGAGTSSPESRANIAPVVSVQGETVNGVLTRNARVGEEVVLLTHVADDGLPKPRRTTAERDENTTQERMMRPPRRTTVGKTNGLFLSWNKFRGPGEVSFEPAQVKPWEDTRTSANSPWGALWTPPPIPEDGMYEVKVTFSEPGEYILWARGDDGGLYHDQYVTVNVSP